MGLLDTIESALGITPSPPASPAVATVANENALFVRPDGTVGIGYVAADGSFVEMERVGMPIVWGAFTQTPLHTYAVTMNGGFLVVTADLGVKALPNGLLLKGSGPMEFIVSKGQRRWIPDPATFQALGLNSAAVATVDDATLNAIPNGPQIPTGAKSVGGPGVSPGSASSAIPWLVGGGLAAGLALIFIASLKKMQSYEDSGALDHPSLNAWWQTREGLECVMPGKFKEAYVSGYESAYVNGYHQGSGNKSGMHYPSERQRAGTKLDAEENADRWLEHILG